MSVRSLSMGLRTLRLAFAGAACAYASGASPASNSQYPIEYFCPHSNVTLVANKLEARLFGRAYKPFPRSQSEVEQSTVGFLSFALKDCSTAEFVCLEAKRATPSDSFFLVVPRRLEAGRDYEFRGVRAVAFYSTSSGQNAIQVVLWQPLGLYAGPFKLTMEQKRGVVFWEGIRFLDGSSASDNETCLLQSTKGLLHEVRLVIPKSRPTVID